MQASKNNQDFGSRVNRNMIRASRTIMYLSGYLTESQNHMYWQRREETNNTLVKKAMSRNEFDDVMRYTHFANLNKPNEDEPFWKVAMLFKNINDTATKYVEKTEFVSVDESMIRYFGPHSLKRFMKGKPTRFGFKIWFLPTTTGRSVVALCDPCTRGHGDWLGLILDLRSLTVVVPLSPALLDYYPKHDSSGLYSSVW
ncbi:hypothetical protein O3P69_000969 [Scylla paramamosain]|uniref:PiggyBac transposable element-derived protein domain-containing protein n=1 Tax=Scylla paramamosain TaxID=85552 RepID=A0AAW0UVB6_SCYPA